MKLTTDIQKAYIMAEQQLAEGAALLARMQCYPNHLCFVTGTEEVLARASLNMASDYAPFIEDEECVRHYIEDLYLT